MGCILGKNQVHVIGDPALSKNGSSETDNSRGGSAASKASRHSGDSGFDDDEAQLISEQMIIQREILSRPAFGGKTVERLEEKRILDTLHEEGLIQRPITKRAFGVSFEVLAEDSEIPGTLKKPPPRLARLEEKRRKRKPLTEEQIREKLRKAEKRRKKQEQIRLAKIQSLQKTDLTNAMESFVQTQRDLEETAKTKEEIAAENRERKLKEKLEKLRLKKEHAAEVRRRKAEAAAAAVNAAGDGGIVMETEKAPSIGKPNVKGYYDREGTPIKAPTIHGISVNTAENFGD